MTHDLDRAHLKVRTGAWLDREARIRRDTLLAKSDWMVVRALDTGVPMDPRWIAYRKALRDITSQPKYPTTIEWPGEPRTMTSTPENLS